MKELSLGDNCEEGRITRGRSRKEKWKKEIDGRGKDYLTILA